MDITKVQESIETAEYQLKHHREQVRYSTAKMRKYAKIRKAGQAYLRAIATLHPEVKSSPEILP